MTPTTHGHPATKLTHNEGLVCRGVVQYMYSIWTQKLTLSQSSQRPPCGPPMLIAWEEPLIKTL